jgi:hypothetical protein
MARASDAVLKIAWLLAAVICIFTTENLWVDRWLQQKSHHKLPSLMPEALGPAWLLILLGLGISLILLAVCQLLLMRDAVVSKRKKVFTGVVVLAAAILSGGWFVATGGTALAKRSRIASSPGKRRVVLRWQASTTPNVRYNVYRGAYGRVHPDKLNSQPIEGTTFTDTTVASGQAYWYVVKAVNEKGEESQESNETSATIP